MQDPRVEEYKARLDSLESQAEKLMADAKAEYESTVGSFKELLERWTLATEAEWENLKGEADAMVTALEEKLNERSDAA